MAKKNLDIVEAKKGVIYKYIVNTINGNYALKNDDGKNNYINQLIEYENQDVCLIAYCVLNTKVYIIVKGANKKVLNNYIKSVNRAFYSADGQNTYPFRPIVDSSKIKNKNLQKQINTVHKFAPNGDAATYLFCSYNYLAAGQTDAVTIIKNAQYKTDLTLQEFENAINASIKVKQKSMQEFENYSVVMQQVKKRYMTENGPTSESNIMFIIGEVCDRTKLSYKRVANKMGIKKNRRDVMIGVICDMIIRRRYPFDLVIAKLGLKKENKVSLILEVIAELNRVYSYSYDYIISALGIADPYYNLLAKLISGIHKQFGYEFETICVRFHLQNDLIELREKSGF